MDDFLLRAALAGLGVALVAGPLGSFVVWRRMAYFGDTIAHAALLGVALGVLLNINLTLGIVAVCMTLAMSLVGLQQQKRLADDTLLGILSHGSLAMGLLALAFLETFRVDLMGYLFGDILAVNRADILWIWGGGALALGILVFLWRPLLSLTVNEDLARVEGVPAVAVRLTYMMLLALVIAVAMKVVGILLITSLLIIPAAAARRFARSPEGMAATASGLGVIAVMAGLWGSYHFDTPSGPSIVVAALSLFVLSLLSGLVLGRGR